MPLEVKIYNQSLVLQGTIQTAITAAGNEMKRGIGTGSFSMPASDATGAALLAKKAIACVTDDTVGASLTVPIGVAIFIIDKIDRDYQNGQWIINVSGPDFLQELSYSSVGTDVISGDGYLSTPTAVDDILAHTSPEWTANLAETPDVYLMPNGESALQALFQVNQQSGLNFVLFARSEPMRYLMYPLQPTGSTGQYVISDQPGIGGNKLISLKITEDASNVVTRIHVSGGGLGDGSLTLKNMDSVTPPTGFSVYAASSLIVNDALETELGRAIEVYQSFPNYRPEDDTAAAETGAANALYQAGLNWLKGRVATTIYTATIIPTGRIMPGASASLSYTNPVTGDLVEGVYLHINEVKYTTGVEGVRAQVTLTESQDYQKQDDGDYVANIISRHDETLKHANTTAVGTSPSSGDDHGGLSASSLLDDDHPQYARADGSRQFTGNISLVSGATVDGVDLSAHAGDASAHHAPVSQGSGISLSGQEVSVNSTVVRSSISVIGGDGLTGGGTLIINRTLAVGAGDGINVLADSVNVDTTVVRTTRTITAGDGLSGGGALSANRTLAVDASVVRTSRTITAGDGLSGGGDLSANRSLTVDSTVVRTSRTITAGDGLTGGGDLSANRSLALTTPGTLSASSTNAAAGSHTHAITASSNPGAVESLLKSTSLGGLTLESLTLNGAFAGQGGVFSGALDVGQDLTVGMNVLFVDESGGRVGVNCVPDAQFALDVNGNLRAQGWIVGKHALQIADATMICHFDGREPYSTDFSGVATGHMGQVPVITGPEVYRPGKFGKALQLAGGTTNIITNPSFETVTTGWIAGGANTITRSSAVSKYGKYSLKCTYQDTINLAYLNLTLTATIHTGSIYVWIPSDYDGSAPYLSFQSYTGMTGTTVAYADINIRDDWQRLEITATPDAADLVGHFMVRTGTTNPTPGKFIYIDAAQIETKSYSSPYADGSLPGHSWSGAAHQSASSRTPNTIHFPDFDEPPSSYSISLYINPMKWSAATGHIWLDYVGTGTNRLLIYSNPGMPHLRFYLINSIGSMQYDYTGITTRSYEWIHVVVVRDKSNGQLNCYIDGNLMASLPLSGANDEMKTTLIAGNLGTNYQTNALIDELLFVERALSADEIRAIYESNAPVFAETSTFSWSDPSTSIWVDEEGLYGRSAAGDAILGLSTVAGKSWGGLTLDAGDLLIGRSGSNYLRWDESAGTLTVAGDGGAVTNIDGGNIQTGTVTATQINVSQLSAITADMGSITAGTVTGATIRTAASGARVEMNSAGFDAYDKRLMSFWLGSNKVSEFGTFVHGIRLIATENISGQLLDNPDFTDYTEIAGYDWPDHWEDAVGDGGDTYCILESVTYDGRDCCKFSWTEDGPLTWAAMYNEGFIDMSSHAGVLLSLYAHSPLSYYVMIRWYDAGGTFVSEERLGMDYSGGWKEYEIRSNKPAGASKCKVGIVTQLSFTPYATYSIYIANMNLRRFTSALGTFTLNKERADVSDGFGVGSFLELSNQSATLGTSTPEKARVYIKGHKLIVAYRESTTTKYKYIDLDGSSGSWVHTTTAP